MTGFRKTSLVHTAPTIATASTTLALAANPDRTYALFINDGITNIVYLKVGAAAVLREGIRLALGESYEMSAAKGNLSTEAVNGIAAAADIELLVTEGT